MSLFFGRAQRVADLAATEIALARRGTSVGSVAVTSDTALRASAVWAALRLRADLISTMPVDLFRMVDGVQIEVPKPGFLQFPGGSRVHVTEWLYSSQVDLDRYGNAFGVVSQRDGQGNPARVDLVPAADVTVRGSGSEPTEYRLGSRTYDPRDVWHERQFTLSGVAMGLSPIAYAAYAIGGVLSAQKFALDWFGNGAAPGGHLRNTARILTAEESQTAKSRFKAAVLDRDVLVTGSDWEFQPVTAAANDVGWLEQMQYGVTDIARFFGVPSDLIDAAVSGSSVTYANITQRNLQLLIMNLGPAIIRREAALTAATPAPRFVKLNTDALLRMDPASRGQTILARVAGRTLAPSEARALDNLPPFTPEQMGEFDALFGPKLAPVVKQASAREQVNVHVAPQTLSVTPPTVNVTAPVEARFVDERPVPAPTIVNEVRVEPTTVEVRSPDVTVEPAQVEVTVEPVVELPAPVVQVDLPARRTTTTVKRDPRTGLVTETTSTEEDA